MSYVTGKGLPDIGIIEELAKALGVSIGELLTGEYRENENMSGNMKKVQFYICPICGNIITSVGAGSTEHIRKIQKKGTWDYLCILQQTWNVPESGLKIVI